MTTAPLTPQQRLRFGGSGSYVLSVEGVLLSSDFAGLQYHLVRDQSGLDIPIRQVLFRLHSSSRSRARVEVGQFEIPGAGSYSLSVTGAGLSAANPADSIVITRPVRAQSVLRILALIGLGFLTVGSLVSSGLILAQDSTLGMRPGGVATAGRPPLEHQVASATTVVLARTVLRGSVARFRVLESWKGSLHPLTAGLGTEDGLYLDTGDWEPMGYRPVDKQDVVLLLRPLPGTERGETPVSILAQPLEILPLQDGRLRYESERSGARDLSIDQLRRMVTESAH